MRKLYSLGKYGEHCKSFDFFLRPLGDEMVKTPLAPERENLCSSKPQLSHRHIWTPPFMQARFTQLSGPGLLSYIRLRGGTFIPCSEP